MRYFESKKPSDQWVIQNFVEQEIDIFQNFVEQEIFYENKLVILAINFFLLDNYSVLLFPHYWLLVLMLSWDAPRGTLYENKKRPIQEMGRYFCMSKQWRVIDYCFNSSIVNVANFMHPVLSQVSVELKYVSKNFKND